LSRPSLTGATTVVSTGDVSVSATSMVTFVASGRPRAVELNVGVERAAFDDRRRRQPHAALATGDGRGQQQVADLEPAGATQRCLEGVIDAALAAALVDDRQLEPVLARQQIDRDRGVDRAARILVE
jgi:hypothetical protein